MAPQGHDFNAVLRAKINGNVLVKYLNTFSGEISLFFLNTTVTFVSMSSACCYLILDSNV